MPYPAKKRILLKEDILSILRKLDEDLEGMQRKIKLYCVGGTEMMLKGLRTSSKDLDFIASREDSRAISGSVAAIKHKDKIEIDLFPDGQMPGYRLPNYSENSKRVHYHFTHIELYHVDKANFILTKALAAREPDTNDIITVFKPEEIPESEMRKRFNQLELDKNKKEEFQSKFELFIKRFYKKQTTQ